MPPGELRRAFPSGNGSANPGGRPRTDPEVKALLKMRGPDAVREILAIMDNPAEETKYRLAAAMNIADRAYGKPVQAISGPEGEPLAAVLDFGRLPDEQLRAFISIGRSALRLTAGSGADVGGGGDGPPGSGDVPP